MNFKDFAKKLDPDYIPSILESIDLGEKNVPTNPKLWSQAKSKAKAKFDVYPSAYANGWAAKWYKSKGGGWKTESVEVEESTPAYRKMMKDYKGSDMEKVFKILDKEGYRLGAQGDTLVRNMLKKFKGNVKKAAAEIMNRGAVYKESVELDEAPKSLFDVKPTSKDWMKGKLRTSYNQTNKGVTKQVMKKGQVIDLHPFDGDRFVGSPNRKDKGKYFFIAKYNVDAMNEGVELDEAKSPVKSLSKEAKSVLAMAINRTTLPKSVMAHPNNLDYFTSDTIDAAIKFLDKNSKKLTPAGRHAAREIVKAMKESVEERSLHPDLMKVVKTKEGYQLMMYSPSAGKFVAQGKPQPTEKKAEKSAMMFASVDVEEGFSSDAQRRAAFASGYKAKGKKGKKEEVEIDEASEKQMMDMLRKEYGKINKIDPASPTYKKLTGMLDRLAKSDPRLLKKLAGAKIKFVSMLAQNYVNRMKESVELDELRKDVFCIVDKKGKVVAANLTKQNSHKEISRHKDATIVLDPDAKVGDTLKYFAKEDTNLDEMSAKAHYNKMVAQGKVGGQVVSPIDRKRFPNREREGLEGPYRVKRSGLIYYYDKKAGKYYDPQSDMYLQVRDIMEETEDQKPLITWMDKFEKALKSMGSSYAKVDPVEALKLYYRKVDPKTAAKKLK